MPAAQRSSCYSTVVPDYVRLCRGMLAACVPTEQPDDPCACDLDGVVPAQNASGAALLIATGRPGCAAHTSVWGHQSSPLCYVSQRCTAPGVSDVHDWPYIRWRPCTPSRGQACPARCQRALDALLAVGPVRSCITGPAQRQALCPVLDMLSGLGASAAADSSPSAPLDGQHFTSMRYLRLWAKANGCRVDSEFVTSGLSVGEHFVSVIDIIFWTVMVCCCPMVLVIVLRTQCCGLLGALRQVFAAQENNNRGRRRTHRRTKGYQRVSTADSSNDDEYDGGNNEAAVPAS